MFVDQAFVDTLEAKLGVAKWAKVTAKSLQRIIRFEWEPLIRLNFDGQKHVWEFPEPVECLDLESLRAGAEWPTISLNEVDVGKVFDPTVNKIRAMVDDQVAKVRAKKGKNPKVGASPVVTCFRAPTRHLMTTSTSSWPEGLADRSTSSPFSRITSATVFKFYSLVAQTRMANTPLRLAQNVGTLLTLCNRWTAICRGAVIHAATISGIPAFSVQVQARVARSSYGVTMNDDWSAKRHARKDKYWCEDRQAWMASNQMDWFLKVVCSPIACLQIPQVLTVRPGG